jgi:hypothetical protein
VRIGRLLICVALFALAALAGCRQMPFIAPDQVLPPDMSKLSDAETLKTLEGQLFGVQTMKAWGIETTFKSSQEKGSCDLVILVRAPEKVRVIGQKTPVGEIFSATADRNEVRQYVPSEKKQYIYPVQPGGGRSLVTVPWPVVLGVRGEVPEGYLAEHATLSRREDGLAVVILPEPGGGPQEKLLMDATTLLPKVRELRWANGGPAVEVEYKLWTRVGQLWWPMWIQLRTPERTPGKWAQVEMSFVPAKVKLNESISSAAFELDLPANTKTEVVPINRVP